MDQHSCPGHIPGVVSYTPNVIEPSFGIDRIMYAILEHSYYEREDEAPPPPPRHGAVHLWSLTGAVHMGPYWHDATAFSSV